MNNRSHIHTARCTTTGWVKERFLPWLALTEAINLQRMFAISDGQLDEATISKGLAEL
jgi:hypothetical protein